MFTIIRSIRMFAMFTQFFAMFAKLFSAGEKLSSSLDHLATWADESAGSFADEARILRVAKSNQLKRDTTVLIDNSPTAA